MARSARDGREACELEERLDEFAKEVDMLNNSLDF